MTQTMPTAVVRGLRAIFPPQSPATLAAYAARLETADPARRSREVDRILFRLCWWGGRWWSRFLLWPSFRRLTIAERESVARQAVGLEPVPALPEPTPAPGPTASRLPPGQAPDLRFADSLLRRPKAPASPRRPSSWH